MITSREKTMKKPAPHVESMLLGGGVAVRRDQLAYQLEPLNFASGYGNRREAVRCPKCSTVWDKPINTAGTHCHPCRKIMRDDAKHGR